MFAGLVLALAAVPQAARAAPYADMVMDMRSGEVLQATNADSRLHPASLTKMMTLYVAFEAIRTGEISLDTRVTISRHAASEPPSKLGLRAGQQVQLRYLIRAAAVKSANDAATAIGEAISGSEAAFARRMNRTARALGMTRTTFRNAHGLTEEGHLSTARDMTILGRHVFYDYPQYYNLFSRRSADAGLAEVSNTNRRFLDGYPGADGIKTGYTRAAGFNLVASAERGSQRIIATVFGGTSTAQRNARMAELMDIGFSRAPARVAVNRPQMPRYDGIADEEVVVADAGVGLQGAAGKVVRVNGAVQSSPRPRPRGTGAAEPPQELLAAIETDVAAAIASATDAPPAGGASAPDPGAIAADVAAAMAADPVTAGDPVAATDDTTDDMADAIAAQVAAAMAELQPEAAAETVETADAPADATDDAGAGRVDLAGLTPRPRPAGLVPVTEGVPEAVAQAADVQNAGAQDAAAADSEPPAVTETASAAGTVAPPALPGRPPQAVVELAVAVAPDPASLVEAAAVVPATVAPVPENRAALSGLAAEPGPDATVLAAAVAPAPAFEPVRRPEPEVLEVVTRASASGGRNFSISVGRYTTRTAAEKALIATALSDMSSVGGAARRIVQRNGAFEANFTGMSEAEAMLACRRIAARGEECEPVGS